MTHPNADDLALLALGEQPSPEQDVHLTGCTSCAAELMQLQAAVRLGRSTANEERLIPPAPQVWLAVKEELGLDLPPKRLARRRRRVVTAGVVGLLVGAAAAATAFVVLGTNDWPAAEVLARSQLRALPDWPTASGAAELERLSDGRLVVHVRVQTPTIDGAYRELWLLGARSAAVSLGVVDQNDATYAVPSDVDLNRFNVIDISRESPNGDPAHSTDSIVRGRLHATSAAVSDDQTD